MLKALSAALLLVATASVAGAQASDPATASAPAPATTQTTEPAGTATQDPAGMSAAEPASEEPSARESGSYSMLLARIGTFIASDKAYEDIYGKGGQIYGGELRFGGRILGWVEGSYRKRAGQLSFTGEPTNVKVAAIEGGVLVRPVRGSISPYAGGGVGYFVFNEVNEPMGTATQSKVGYCGLGGVSVVLARHLAFDARVKYSSSKMQPADFAINVGGLTLDVGIGLRF